MTTIVAVRKNGVAAIAADTMSSQGSTSVPGRFRSRPTKIVPFGDSFLGVAGSTATIRVMESLARRHAESIRLHSIDAIFESFREMQATLIREYHLMTGEDDDEQPYESLQANLLIVNSSGIYELQSYREVIEYETFWATGSGYRFAIGAMEAMYETMSDALAIAERAVEVACTFDCDSGLPVESHSVELAG